VVARGRQVSPRIRELRRFKKGEYEISRKYRSNEGYKERQTLQYWRSSTATYTKMSNAGTEDLDAVEPFTAEV